MKTNPEYTDPKTALPANAPIAPTPTPVKKSGFSSPVPGLSKMDIARPDLLIKKKKRQRNWIIGGAVGVVVITIGLSQLKPAVPTIDRNLVWLDTVKQGPLVRQVKGSGTLIPDDIRVITARTSGRVDQIVLRPGAKVEADSVILVIINQQVEQDAINAESDLRVAEADLISYKFQLESDLLSREATAQSAKSRYEQTKIDAEAAKIMYDGKAMSEVEFRKSAINLASAEASNNAEQKQLAFMRSSIAPRTAAREVTVEQLRSKAQLRREDAQALKVVAGMHGVLQTLTAERGAQVGQGAVIARVADPEHLKAQIRVAETQAKDIVYGQNAEVDTRNGTVKGKVVRIDPSVQNGTVAVDISIEDPLPLGARPDLSIDGTIELQRLANVKYVGRPLFGKEKSTVGIFKMESDGVHATRVPVKLGVGSVSNIEIVEGLQPGDQVILSDTTPYDAASRIKLK